MKHSPFKFLAAFGPEDYDHFFGRDRETAQLYNAVYASNLTLLYGASGTGKTSLVNCGLRNKFYYTEWLPIFIRRGERINESLRKEVAITLNSLDRKLVDNLLITNDLLKNLTQLYFAHYKPVYLIFDQFEELYISGELSEQIAFYQQIKSILESNLQVKIILIIREEWIAFLNDFERIIPNLFDNRLRVERMTNRTVARVIYQTLQYHDIGLTKPKITIKAMLNNLRNNEGIALPNLQVYLDKLYRKAVSSGNAPVTFSPQLVHAVGPIANVLADFLEEQLLYLEDKLRTERGIKNPRGLPNEILFTLVTDEHTKRSLDLTAIQERLPNSYAISDEDLQYCLDEFRRIRILRREQ